MLSSRLRRAALLPLLALLVAPVPPGSAPDDSPWAAPPLERAISIRDGRSGEVRSLDQLLDSLTRADVVFLGETHDDETTHRVEQAIFEGLLERRSGKVVLALEMFERDVQDDLDAYLHGSIDETTFLERARPWRNYRTAYRGLIETARKAGAPVMASNFPRPLLRRMRMEGEAVLDALEGSEARQAPRELHPNTPAYWERVDNAIRGHVGMTPSADDDRLTSTQSLWDNTMGETCADALDTHPGHLVLHVNGSFHSNYWDGTVHQLKTRKPDARVLTIAVQPTSHPAVADPSGPPVADWVVFAESRASDVRDGKWSVSVSRPVDYRFHLPKSASPEKPVPLLIWLSDDGFTAGDGLDLWKNRLGDEAAIVVLEPLHRSVAPDLGNGGYWFWGDSFAADLGTMTVAIERAWAYLSRHQPLDPRRVCLAGEGTGATVVAAATLLTDRIATRSVALGPRRYAKLSDFPLPLPEYRDEDAVTDRRLTVVTAGDGQSWWADELAAQASVGLDNELLDPTDDPWEIEMQAENLVRRSLDLGSRPAPSPEGRKYLVVDEDDSPRKRHWARLLALRALTENDLPVAVVDAAPTDGTAEEITTELKPEMFRATGSLPPCPGPFGGTTVVVLPRGSSAELEQRWLEVQEDDPLTKKSRFHRMRVATTDPGERGLITVLSTLKEEGRRNILLVPAEFAADAGTVQSLQRRVRSLEDEMTFQWLPGLGGREVLTPGSATAEAEDPIHHRLTVELQPSRNRLTVTDTIQLPESLRRDGLELSLSPDLRIRSSRPRLTRVGTTDDGSLVRYAVKTMPADGVLTLSANGTINDALGDLSEEYSRGFRSTRGIVGSQGVYLDGGSGWIPRFGDQLIDFEMEVSIPADWHVISQGAGTSNDGQGLARWTSELSVEQVYLVGGPLVVARDRAGDTEVLTYLHERDDALSRKYLDTAARYLEMYRRLIGPHPYSKFALVENFWETGFGMPSFTLLGPQVIRMPFILHSSFPHEILHDWWGNSVYVESKEGNWCEGLTAYMADHLVQEQRERGADYRRNTLQKYRNYVRESRDFPLTEFRSRHSAATEAVGYGKALMTFHQLRRKVGDDAFRAALAAFYREQLGQRASWADIEAAFEDQVDEELGPFFAQWIERTGAPELALTKMRSRRDGSRHRLTGRLDQVQAEAPYDLDVPLRVLTQDGAETHVVSTSSSSREFDLVLDAAPLSVAADPSFDLFRRLDPRETPASIGQLFGEPSILAVVPGSDPAERALHEQLVASWQSDAHSIEVVADTELDALPRDRSLWLLGHSNRFLSELLAHGESLGLSADRRAGRVTLAGETVDREDHSVVAILRHPSNLERAVGWIALGPDAAAPGLARKLPHYGKYSYLAFQGDEPTNVVKGQWPVHDSPLVVHLGDQPRLVPTEKRQALAELPPVFSERKLMSHVEWLAAPEREGRGLGTAGGAAAAEYVARAMAEIGLQPGGDDGTWFQSFTVSDGPGGRPVTARNVVGVLPGSKDSWGEQSVVLGAHHDHLGRGWPDVHSGDEGRIHPGADDNASGVAVLLELARVLVSEGGGSRNLVVVAFGAEESGRHGSRHYVKNPTLPLDQVHSMINLDAVGRLFGGKLSVHGTGTADEWPHVFRGCGYVTGVEPKIVPGGAEGSDQASFIDEGIPAVQVFTGVHADYHRPSDTADGIDGAGLVSVAAFVKEAVGFLLERATPMASRIEGAMAAPTTRPASAGSRRVSFGTVPDFGWEGQGVRIESLVAGGPAEAAGLAAGDVLLSIAGEPLTDLRGFSGLLKKLKPGQAVETVLLRNGERLVKTVEVRAR